MALQGLGAGFQYGGVKEMWERPGSGLIPMAELLKATILIPAVLGLNITGQALCPSRIDRQTSAGRVRVV